MVLATIEAEDQFHCSYSHQAQSHQVSPRTEEQSHFDWSKADGEICLSIWYRFLPAVEMT